MKRNGNTNDFSDAIPIGATREIIAPIFRELITPIEDSSREGADGRATGLTRRRRAVDGA